MARFRIRTNWTNSVSALHEFALDDLADAASRDKLKWAMSDPERLRPGESRQALTERAAAAFAELEENGRRSSRRYRTLIARGCGNTIGCGWPEKAQKAQIRAAEVSLGVVGCHLGGLPRGH